jgi:homoserine kinase
MNQIEIFAPGSVANISCGFDVLGFCLDPIGDIMRI